MAREFAVAGTILALVRPFVFGQVVHRREELVEPSSRLFLSGRDHFNQVLPCARIPPSLYPVSSPEPTGGLEASTASRIPESRAGPIGYLLALCLVHSASRLKRIGLLGHTKGLFYQISCHRKPMSLGNYVLKLACIFAIDSIIQYLTQKR